MTDTGPRGLPVVDIPLAERWEHDLCLHLIEQITEMLGAEHHIEALIEEGHLQIRGLQEPQLVAGLEVLGSIAQHRAERIATDAPVSDTGHVQLPRDRWARWGSEQRTVGQAAALRAALAPLPSHHGPATDSLR